MSNHRERRFVLLAASALSWMAAGCGASDPCDGKAGTCLAVHVTSTQVSELDQVALGVSGSDGSLLASIAAPPTVDGLHSLPIDVPFALPPTAQGSLVLIGIAYRAHAIVAEGYMDVTIAAGDHRKVTLSLGPPLPSDTPDGGMDGGTGGGGGSAPAGTRLAAGAYNLLSTTSDASYVAVVTGDTSHQLQVLDGGGRLLANLGETPTLDTDSGHYVGRLYAGGTLLYEVAPVAIGSTGRQSSTLKAWTPRGGGAQTLGSGVPGAGAFAASRDGQVVAFARNVNATGATADLAYAPIGSTPLTLASATAASWLSWQLTPDGTLYALVDGAVAGQHDLLRAPRPGSGAPARVCTNCSDFALSDDGTTVAAIATPVNGVGKVVVGSTALATTNGLGAATMAPSADAAWLAGFVPSRQSVLYYAPPSGGGPAWDLHQLDFAGTVATTPRVTGGVVQGVWMIDSGWLAFATQKSSSGAIDDVHVLPLPTGAALSYATGTTGELYDVSPSGARFTYVDESAAQTSGWRVEVGAPSGGAVATVAQLPVGSYGGTFVDEDDIVYFDLAKDQLAIARISTGAISIVAPSVVSYRYAADARRLVYVVSGTAASDGVWAVGL